jgi:ubiquinone/menaquinone biosynthesis C-methylase UbiE
LGRAYQPTNLANSEYSECPDCADAKQPCYDFHVGESRRPLLSMTTEKELAYRYDLFVATDWQERYDSLLGDNVELPVEGTILDVNCGTGTYSVLLAGRMKEKGGDVIGVDLSEARLDLARARALVLNLENIRFEVHSPIDLPFEDDRFDAVIGDASMLSTGQAKAMLPQMLRVARRDVPVVLKMITSGSFDEFFSVYWEALHECELDAQTWAPLEVMINERPTTSQAKILAVAAGLRNVKIVTSKEEFSYENEKNFLEAPLIADNFLSDWLSIIPENRRPTVKQRISDIIQRDRHDGPFELSIKASLIFGVK